MYSTSLVLALSCAVADAGLSSSAHFQSCVSLPQLRVLGRIQLRYHQKHCVGILGQLPVISCRNSPTRSSMHSATIILFRLQPSHLSRKCFLSSISSTVHYLQDLSSLFRPLHLPVSSLRAAVPPLSFTKSLLCLLQLPSTHLALQSMANSPCITSNLDCFRASASHPIFATPHTMSLSICPSYFNDSLPRPSMPAALQPNSKK